MATKNAAADANQDAVEHRALGPETVPGLIVTGDHIRAQGAWMLAALGPRMKSLRRALSAAPRDGHWDLSGLTALDSAGALLLLDAWGNHPPARLDVSDAHRQLLDELHALERARLPPRRRLTMTGTLVALGARVLAGLVAARQALTLLGQLCGELVALIAAPRNIPARELSATLYKAGLLALPITGLVGLLIGVVLSYLSALQLRTFGAESLIVDLVGLATVRELGPLLAAILVAGRSGSAMTAELGVMRLTEELDALRVMGVAPVRRLILPRVLGLGVLMPLVAFWTSVCGIVGGMLVADLELGLGFGQFLAALPDAIPVGTYWLSAGKSVVFGLVVGVIACHYGLRIEPNTASLGAETTRSVVTAITLVILVNALFAIAFRDLGWHD
ncbi:MAG: ABC transporter permease [Porticoccaceae bacterium]|nr:MAG: ABC transporter permease [Porticoccaceae bacterium]